LSFAQTTPPAPPTTTTPSGSPSPAQPGAPDQGPGSNAKQLPGGSSSGSRPIGPPAAPTPDPQTKDMGKKE
jgi:hypothetical protein